MRWYGQTSSCNLSAKRSKMENKLPCFCALVLVLNLSLVFSQGVRSPCPLIFDYESDALHTYGKIILQGKTKVAELELRANFTIAGDIPNIGELNVFNNSIPLRTYNEGKSVQFRVTFPETSSLPMVTAIIVNGNTICSGPKIQPEPGQKVTNYSLKKRRYYYNKTTSMQQTNTTTIKPVVYDVNATRPSSTSTEPRPTTAYTLQSIKTPKSTKSKAISSATTQHSTTVTTQRPIVWQPESQPDSECGTRSTVSVLPLIKGGSSYMRGDLPWLVAIYRQIEGSLNFICGGTLVSNRHIVTAAHCLHLKRLSISDLVVKVGVHNLNDWDDDIPVTRTLLDASTPDSFENFTLKNDILVLTFNKRVEFNAYIRPVCLWDGDIRLERVVGTSGIVAGWGSQKTMEAGVGVPQSVNVPIVDTTTCRSSNIAFHTLTSVNTFCAGSRNGSGPCTGDSGGGLYLVDGGKWRLRGVVSLSIRDQVGSCDLNEYVVFTDTAQYLPWIRQVLQKEYLD